MSNSHDLNTLHQKIMVCQQCILSETRNKAVPGEGPIGSTIMVVGEAPGHVNDEVGRPFVGHGGKIFDNILAKIGIDREQVFITNAVKCWPPGNRKPKSKELTACQGYLNTQIKLVQPKLIFALGTTAYQLLTGENIQLRNEHGKIGYHGDIPVCAIFHPNGIRYIKGGMNTIVTDMASALDQLKVSEIRKNSIKQYTFLEDGVG